MINTGIKYQIQYVNIRSCCHMSLYNLTRSGRTFLRPSYGSTVRFAPQWCSSASFWSASTPLAVSVDSVKSARYESRSV